jgi:hypothetical protein
VNSVSEPRKADESVPLKDPILAAFLAWVLPGLGHLYQGRKAKAALFFVCIMGTFIYGVYLGGGGRVVYWWWQPGDKRLPYLCQMCIGLPAMPAVVQAYRASRGKDPLWGGFMAPPRPDSQANVSDATQQALRNQSSLSELNLRFPRRFELGTVYTMVAGLLNVLVILDAAFGPALAGSNKPDDESQDEDKDTDV